MSDIEDVTPKVKPQANKLPRERILSAKVVPGGVDCIRLHATCLHIPIPGPDGVPVMTEFVIGARSPELVQGVTEDLKSWAGREFDPTLIRQVLFANMNNFNLDEDL